MAKIKYEIIGVSNFLRGAKYSHFLPEVINEFEEKFLLAEIIKIRFEESINPDPKKLAMN